MWSAGASARAYSSFCLRIQAVYLLAILCVASSAETASVPSCGSASPGTCRACCRSKLQQFLIADDQSCFTDECNPFLGVPREPNGPEEETASDGVPAPPATQYGTCDEEMR